MPPDTLAIRASRGFTGPSTFRRWRLPVRTSKHIALFDGEAALLLCGQDVFRHDAFPTLDPVDAANHGRVNEDAAGRNAVAGELYGLNRCAETGGDEVRRAAVVHLALPEEVGKAVHVGDVVAVERHAEEVGGRLAWPVRHLVAACPALAALEHKVQWASTYGLLRGSR